MSATDAVVELIGAPDGGFRALSPTGASLTIGSAFEPRDGRGSWRPSELLMAALGGCLALDVSTILQKRRYDPRGLCLQVRPGPRDETLPGRPFEEFEVECQLGRQVPLIAVERAITLAASRYCTIELTLERKVNVRHLISSQKSRESGSG